MKSFPFQTEVHKSPARFRLIDGGRRVGKSVFGGREAFAQSIIPGSYTWIVGPNMDLAEKEFRVVWQKAIKEEFLPAERKSERELWIKFQNGSFLECRSEENPDQLIGEGLDLIVCAEAARLKFRTWDQYLRPALADRQGKALFTSTPRGFNWFHDFYQRGQDEDQTNWASWKFPSRLNPILPESEIIEAKRNSTPEAYKQEWEADFIAYAGLVFPEFADEHHVKAIEFNPLMRTSLWVDPGSTAPYAVLLVQISPDEHVYILDEIYRTGRVTEQIIREVEEKWGDKLYDNSNPRDEVEVIVDQAATEAVATWRLNGWRAGGEKPKIKQGLEVHHKFLRGRDYRPPGTDGDDDPGAIYPYITISPRCFNVIKEHGAYHYPDDTRRRVERSPSELPVDIDNHTIDAIRYGYYNTFRELFNETDQVEDVIHSTAEDLGLDLSRMRIDDSFGSSGFQIEDYYSGELERDFTLT